MTEVSLESQEPRKRRSASWKLGLALGLMSVTTFLVVGTILLVQHFIGAIDFGGRGGITKTPEGAFKIAYIMSNPAGRARKFRAHARLLCGGKDVLDGDVVVAGAIPKGQTTHHGTFTYTAVTPAMLQCLEQGQLELLYDHQDLLPA